MPTVNVPGVGRVRFPDTMSAAEINAAIERDILPKASAAPAAPAPSGDFNAAHRNNMPGVVPGSSVDLKPNAWDYATAAISGLATGAAEATPQLLALGADAWNMGTSPVPIGTQLAARMATGQGATPISDVVGKGFTNVQQGAQEMMGGNPSRNTDLTAGASRFIGNIVGDPLVVTGKLGKVVASEAEKVAAFYGKKIAATADDATRAALTDEMNRTVASLAPKAPAAPVAENTVAAETAARMAAGQADNAAPVAEGANVAPKSVTAPVDEKTLWDEARAAIKYKGKWYEKGATSEGHSALRRELGIPDQPNWPGIEDSGWLLRGEHITINDLEKTKGSLADALEAKAAARNEAIRFDLATPRRKFGKVLGVSPKAIFRDLFEPMTLALQKSGPVGQEIAKGLYAADRSTAQQVGSALYDLERMKKFSPEEKTLFVDIMEGRVDPNTLPADNPVRQSAESQRQLLDAIGKRSEELGLKVQEGGKEVPFQMRPNYMPHPVDFSGKAEPILPSSGRVGGGTVEGGLRHHRGEGSEFSGDPAEALANYYTKAYRQLAEAEQFGLTGSSKDFHAAAQDWAEKAAASGEDPNYTKRAFATSLGEHYKENSDLSAMLNAARSWQSTTKLTTAAIPNITQTANTIAEAGIKNVFKSFVKSAVTDRTASREFAAKSGAIYEGMLYNFMDPSSQSKMGQLQRKIMTTTLFPLTERWNRTIAANAAPFLAEDLLKVAKSGGKRGDKAFADLVKMGVSEDSIRAGVLTDTDKYNAAFNLSHRTQFGNRAEDLPLTWESSDAAKVITQFKSFALKQSYFNARLLREAVANKNPLPLMKFLAASGISGEALSYFNSLVSGYERENKPIPLRLGEDILTAGTFGIVANMMTGVTSGRYDAVAELAAGPSAGDAWRTIAAAGTGKGKNINNALKRDIKPYRIGTRIYDAIDKGRVFPYRRH